MNFRSVIRTFNRLSLPNKVVVGIAAVAGGGALISIPILSLQPIRPPVVVNEDAYYESRINDSKAAEQNNPPLIDTTTPINIPSLSNSRPAPESNSAASGETATGDNAAPTQLNSSFSGMATDTKPTFSSPSNSSSQTTTGLDTTTTEVPSALSTNTQGSSNNITGNPYSNGAYSSPALKGYTSSSSWSNNSNNASPSGLNTPYSSSNPSTSANSYNLQPGQGNTYTNVNPYSQPSPSSNATTAGGVTANPGSIPSEQPSTPNTLDSTSPTTSPN